VRTATIAAITITGENQDRANAIDRRIGTPSRYRAIAQPCPPPNAG
jgi:hypothetical protein